MLRSTLADEFIHRLQTAERTGDVQGLAELFEDDAVLENLTRHNTSSHQHYATSAPLFWRQYLSAFQKIESRFNDISMTDETVILEWQSRGLLAMGIPIDYAGVTIFNFKGDRITKLRTYYDSAAFLPHAAHSDHAYSKSVGQPEISTQASS